MSHSFSSIRPRFEYSKGLLAVLMLCLSLSGLMRSVQAQSRSYTTLQSVEITPLSNGVQIRFAADGLLQYRDADTNGLKMRLFFPDARNGTGKNFLQCKPIPGIVYSAFHTAGRGQRHRLEHGHFQPEHDQCFSLDIFRWSERFVRRSIGSNC
jgi:hypothetical protein